MFALYCTVLYCTMLFALYWISQIVPGERAVNLPLGSSSDPQPSSTAPLGHEELKIDPGEGNIVTNYKMWGTVTRLEKCTAGILTEKRQSTCFRIVS